MKIALLAAVGVEACHTWDVKGTLAKTTKIFSFPQLLDFVQTMVSVKS